MVLSSKLYMLHILLNSNNSVLHDNHRSATRFSRPGQRQLVNVRTTRVVVMGRGAGGCGAFVGVGGYYCFPPLTGGGGGGRQRPKQGRGSLPKIRVCVCGSGGGGGVGEKFKQFLF